MSLLKKWLYLALLFFLFSVSTAVSAHIHDASETPLHSCSICHFSAQTQQLSTAQITPDFQPDITCDSLVLTPDFLPAFAIVRPESSRAPPF